MIEIFKKIYLSTIIVLLTIYSFGQENKILLICIDGLISDVVDYAYSPTIQELIKNSTYSIKVDLRGATYPSSGWASLLTGTYSRNHGVEQDSTWEGNNFDKYPILFERIKMELPNIKTAAVVTNKILYDLILSADYTELVNGDSEAENSMINLLNNNNETSLFFIEFDGMFQKGRLNGFDNSSIEYVNELTKIDSRISNLLTIIENRTNYANEEWTIILTSNHGGKMSGSYGGNSKAENTIPVIISGKTIDKRDLASGLSEAIADKNNSIQINPESRRDFRYIMIKKTNTKLESMHDFTVEFKVYADEWESDPVIIGDKDWGSGANPGWIICRRGNSFKFNINSNGGTRIDANATMTIEDGDWHHVALSFHPEDSVLIYVDGIRAGYVTGYYYPPDADYASPFNYLAIGNEGTLTYNNWKGIIDEIRIWDVVLPHKIIKEYFNKEDIETLNHPYWDKILAYYKMDGTDQVEGSKVIDSGPYDYHGIMVKCDRVHVNPLKQTDIYPTIIEKLGGIAKVEWDLNGLPVKNDVKFILGEVTKNTVSSVKSSHYPNPVMINEQLNVMIPKEFQNSEKSEMKIIDLNGVLHKTRYYSLKGTKTCQIDINGLSPGIYVYSFRSGDRYLLGKFQVND